MVGTLPGEAFLNEFWLDPTLRELLEPQLYFNNLIPTTDATERAVIYNQINNTAAKDIENGVMSLPMPAGEESGLTKLKMTNISELKGKIPKIGYSFELSRDLLENKAKTENWLNTCIKKAAYGISYMVNSLTLDRIQKGRSNPTTPSITWGSDTGKQNPIEDLINSWYDYKQKGYANRAYFQYFNTINHKELVQYLTNREIEFQYEDANTITIPGVASLKNRKFIDVEDQYPEGSYATLDLSPTVDPGIAMWRYIDPEFAVEQPSPDGNGTQYTGVHINTSRMDKNPFTTTVEMWLNILPVLTNKDVVMNSNGI